MNDDYELLLIVIHMYHIMSGICMYTNSDMYTDFDAILTVFFVWELGLFQC